MGGALERVANQRTEGVISLVWGFWSRQAVADRSCELLAQHYAGLDMELVVVDDGNAESYRAPEMPFPVRVVRLPLKIRPLNPCVPLNRGVAEARGDIIAISNPEITHRTPVLVALRDEVIAGGPETYAIAACWAPENKRWHAHSSRAPLYADRTKVLMPAGSQYHFLAAMTRELWDASGGFDEDFRDGAGYDDNDFLMRLARVGARFVMRDDLVVDHPRVGARAAWTLPMFERNRELFMSKWA